MAAQFTDIMRTFKENYQNNLKDKKGKEELNKNLATTYNVAEYIYHDRV
jgi:hypothetical protein